MSPESCYIVLETQFKSPIPLSLDAIVYVSFASADTNFAQYEIKKKKKDIIYILRNESYFEIDCSALSTKSTMRAIIHTEQKKRRNLIPLFTLYFILLHPIKNY